MAIARFLIRRVLTGIVVLWLVATAAFFLFFARPVNTVAHQLAGRAATPQVINEVITNLGLNQPILVQYWHFLDHLPHLNLGYSFYTQQSVNTMLKQDLPPTASSQPGATANAVQPDPTATAEASKGNLFNPSYGSDQLPVTGKGPKRSFALDPLLNSN